MINNQTTDHVKKLNIEDFEAALGDKLSSYVSGKVKDYSFEYLEIAQEEKNNLLLKIVSTLLDPNLEQSGAHRLEQWETGWGENFELFLKNPDNLDLIIPKYFNKYGAVRWRGEFIRPISEKFECHSLAIIEEWLFDLYLRDVSAIYEFGCGTGHNLLRARGVNSKARLFGLDWATSSQRIIDKLAQHKVDTNIQANKFDYFNPDKSFKLETDSAVFTVASLEQVGDRWTNFIDYLIENRPKVCIHIEPIAELLDESILIDYLSIEYFKKRNYLSGFFNGLVKLENEGKVKIHRAQRTNIGSLFIEGYSVVVWSPV